MSYIFVQENVVVAYRPRTSWLPLYLFAVSTAILIGTVFLPGKNGHCADFMVGMIHIIPVLIAALTFTCLLRHDCGHWKYLMVGVCATWLAAMLIVLFKLTRMSRAADEVSVSIDDEPSEEDTPEQHHDHANETNAPAPINAAPELAPVPAEPVPTLKTVDSVAEIDIVSFADDSFGTASSKYGNCEGSYASWKDSSDGL
jgi:hypothetical protein